MERSNPNRPTGGFKVWEQVLDKGLRELDVRTTGRLQRVRANTAMAVDWLQRHNINGIDRSKG
jgi:hypothetical protein